MVTQPGGYRHRLSKPVGAHAIRFTSRKPENLTCDRQKPACSRGSRWFALVNKPIRLWASPAFGGLYAHRLRAHGWEFTSRGPSSHQGTDQRTDASVHSRSPPH